jgi:hypothetical protein
MANNSIGRLRKIGVVAVAILCLSAAMIIPKHLETEAKTQEPEYIPSMIGLDHDFIWNITKVLSYVIKEVYGEDEIAKGRDFGTDGERYAAKDIIEPAMNNIGLWNVHNETINSFWSYNDAIAPRID